MGNEELKETIEKLVAEYGFEKLEKLLAKKSSPLKKTRKRTSKRLKKIRVFNKREAIRNDMKAINHLPVNGEIDVICPRCGKEKMLVERRDDSIFWVCENCNLNMNMCNPGHVDGFK